MDLFEFVKYSREGEPHPVVRPVREFLQDVEAGVVSRIADFIGDVPELDYIEFVPA